jgi:hypothetical protein
MSRDALHRPLETDADPIPYRAQFPNKAKELDSERSHNH